MFGIVSSKYSYYLFLIASLVELNLWYRCTYKFSAMERVECELLKSQLKKITFLSYNKQHLHMPHGEDEQAMSIFKNM
jgi:hypothetical protein